MTEAGITTLILVIANIFCSLQGLGDRFSFKRNNFEIGRIRLQKDYKRLLTAGFFHVSGIHLIINMATLCFFIGEMGLYLGEAKCLLIYFASLIGGNLFSLFIYRRYDDYSAAAGASGAVTGIVFATIALLPGFQISFLGRHLPITGWFYGTMYVLFSMYGLRSKKDNIGHETQLAGGLTGLIAAVLMQPSCIETNYLTILTVVATSIFFIFIIVTRPHVLLIDNKFFNEHKTRYIIENILDLTEVDHEQEIDLILEKIHQNGIGSLSKKDKEKLDHYSKIIQ